MAKNGNSTNSPKHTGKSISKSTAKDQVANEHTPQDAIAQNFTTKYFSNSSEKDYSKNTTENSTENSTDYSQANKKEALGYIRAIVRNPIEHLLDMATALDEITWNDGDEEGNIGIAILLQLISEQIYTSAAFLESLNLEVPSYRLEMREQIKS